MRTFAIIIFTGLIHVCSLYGQEKILAPARSQTKHVTFKPVQEVKSVSLIPDLVFQDFVFTDENSNEIIDSGEKNEFAVKLVNKGKGVAEGVMFRLSTKNPVPGLSFVHEYSIGNINPGYFINLKVPIIADRTLNDSSAEFILEAIESNGFDSYPLNVTIATQQFLKPAVHVVDAVFTTDKGGTIVKNYPINLKILVQNIGAGYATHVIAEFRFMAENCIMLDTMNKFDIGMLKPGQAVELEFPFTATRRFNDSYIPIKIALEEKYHEFANDTIVSVNFDQSLQAKEKGEVIIKGVSTGNYEFEIASLVAEVDRNIPINDVKYDNKYALIIGNEDYSRRQTSLQTEADVIFARRDAEFFREYIVKTLGFTEDHVTLLKDATSAEMHRYIDLVSKLAQRTEKAEIIFYFAGHGFPDENSQIPYLIPVDVNATNLTNAIKLSDLYNKFESSGASRVTIFLDACFSGGGRDQELFTSRGIRVKPRMEIPPDNTIVFSASSGEQSALPYTTKQHGLFTYFLLKKFQDTKGVLTYGEMADYLQSQVPLQSLKINEKEQDPQVIYGGNNKDNWSDRTIR